MVRALIVIAAFAVLGAAAVAHGLRTDRWGDRIGSFGGGRLASSRRAGIRCAVAVRPGRQGQRSEGPTRSNCRCRSISCCSCWYSRFRSRGVSRAAGSIVSDPLPNWTVQPPATSPPTRARPIASDRRPAERARCLAAPVAERRISLGSANDRPRFRAAPGPARTA